MRARESGNDEPDDDPTLPRTPKKKHPVLLNSTKALVGTTDSGCDWLRNPDVEINRRIIRRSWRTSLSAMYGGDQRGSASRSRTPKRSTESAAACTMKQLGRGGRMSLPLCLASGASCLRVRVPLSAGVPDRWSHSVRCTVSRQRSALLEKHGPEKTGLET